MFGLLVSHPRSDLPTVSGGSGVGYLMGDLCRVTRLGDLAGCGDDSNSDEAHMCLVGRLNPYKLEQSWELTFLIGLTLLNTKLALKNFLTHIL